MTTGGTRGEPRPADRVPLSRKCPLGRDLEWLHLGAGPCGGGGGARGLPQTAPAGYAVSAAGALLQRSVVLVSPCGSACQTCTKSEPQDLRITPERAELHVSCRRPEGRVGRAVACRDRAATAPGRLSSVGFRERIPRLQPRPSVPTGSGRRARGSPAGGGLAPCRGLLRSRRPGRGSSPGPASPASRRPPVRRSLQDRRSVRSLVPPLPGSR